LISDTQVTTPEQVQKKLQQAINLNAQAEADYWRDRVKGFAEGKLKRKTALSMLADGMSAVSVSKYTGLSEQEISALKKSFGK
jgi:hypothetical protein